MMTLRPFKPTDLPAVLRLFYDTVHSVGAKYYSPEQVAAWAPVTVDEHKWLTKLQQHISYVVEMDGIIVGFGDMSQTGYVDHIYVHKSYQGKGVALALIKRLEDKARERGIKELTTVASRVAKPLALRQGWELVEEKKVEHRGAEFVTYVMRKKLD